MQLHLLLRRFFLYTIFSERGLRRTTSSGLFSWLFSGSEEDNEDDPHGYASIASNTFTIPEDGVIHLLQRPDLGPITLDELSVEVKRRTNEILSHQRSANGNGGTQATTMRFRQDVKSLSTACRCIHSLQLTEVSIHKAKERASRMEHCS